VLTLSNTQVLQEPQACRLMLLTGVNVLHSAFGILDTGGDICERRDICTQINYASSHNLFQQNLLSRELMPFSGQ
jgi:hypothetical protein